MSISQLSKAVYTCLAALLLANTATHAADAFSTESPWMLGDWNGQRTQLQRQGYDFSFGYTGEMASLIDAQRSSSHRTE